jgi:hypothetical protein
MKRKFTITQRIEMILDLTETETKGLPTLLEEAMFMHPVPVEKLKEWGYDVSGVLDIGTEVLDEQVCRECGCTNDDCSGCIDRTGQVCYWIEDDLCSVCQPTQTILK